MFSSGHHVSRMTSVGTSPHTNSPSPRNHALHPSDGRFLLRAALTGRRGSGIARPGIACQADGAGLTGRKRNRAQPQPRTQEDPETEQAPQNARAQKAPRTQKAPLRFRPVRPAQPARGKTPGNCPRPASRPVRAVLSHAPATVLVGDVHGLAQRHLCSRHL